MSWKKIEQELKARKIIKEYESKHDLEAQLKEKLDMLRNINLLEESLKDESLKMLLSHVDEKDKQTLDNETADIADSYSSMLKAIADSLENPANRAAIIEEIKRRM